MKSLHHTHDVVEDDNGLALAQPLLLDDVMLQVNKIRGLVAEVVSTEAVQHETDSFLHFAHFVRLHVLHYFIGSILADNKGRAEYNINQYKLNPKSFKSTLFFVQKPMDKIQDAG